MWEGLKIVPKIGAGRVFLGIIFKGRLSEVIM